LKNLEEDKNKNIIKSATFRSITNFMLKGIRPS